MIVAVDKNGKFISFCFLDLDVACRLSLGRWHSFKKGDLLRGPVIEKVLIYIKYLMCHVQKKNRNNYAEIENFSKRKQIFKTSHTFLVNIK